jgi:adenylosuccinate lyase
MPHKVNPIDFENAEGNFGWQRALRTSEPEAADQPLAARPDRQHGAAQHGRRARLQRARLRQPAARPRQARGQQAGARADLDAAWDVLAEPIQTGDAALRAAQPVRAAEGADARQGHHARGDPRFIATLEIPEPRSSACSR